MVKVMEVITVPLWLLSFLSPSVVPVYNRTLSKSQIKFIEPLTVIMNEQFIATKRLRLLGSKCWCGFH